MSPENRPPIDEDFLHARIDRLERLLTDGGVPLATRLAARDELRKIRAELDPARIETDAP